VADNGEFFPLWCFCGDENNGGAERRVRFVVTRGRTSDEALQHAKKFLKRASQIVMQDALSVSSARAYSISHPFDWLHTPPRWLQRARIKTGLTPRGRLYFCFLVC